MNYDFGNKRQFRRDVWGIVNAFPLDGKSVLFMPGRGRDDIREALKRFPAKQLFVVDEERAVIANQTRRVPGLRGAGVMIGDIAKRDVPPLAAAILDFMGPIDDRVSQQLAGFLTGAPLASPALLIVNALRGRETGKGREIIKMAVASQGNNFSEATNAKWLDERNAIRMTASDLGRLALLTETIGDAGWLWHPEVTGCYLSTSGQTFRWWALEIVKAETVMAAIENCCDVIVKWADNLAIGEVAIRAHDRLTYYSERFNDQIRHSFPDYSETLKRLVGMGRERFGHPCTQERATASVRLRRVAKRGRKTA